MDQQGAPSFLAGGGDMRARIRAHDWAATSLGPIETWPPSLRTILGLVLETRFPALLLWGAELTCFYNDDYRPMLGAKPEALGRPFNEVWSEAWDIVRPIVKRACDGEASRFESMPFTLMRRGYPEEAYFDFCFSAVRDEAGAIVGVLNTAVETTVRVLAGQRRHAFLLALADQMQSLTEPRAIMAAAVEALGRHLRASRVGYGQVQPDDETIVLETSYADGVKPLTGAFPLNSFAQNIACQRQGLTVVCDDVTAEPSNDPATWAAIETRSFVSVPLIRDGRFRAALYVNQHDARAWSPEDVALVEDVAARTWDVVERARAEESLRDLNETLEQQVAERTKQLIVSQAELRTLYDHSSEYHVLMTALPDGSFVYEAANPAVLRLYDRTREQVVGHSTEEVLGRMGAVEVNRHLAECLRTTRPYRYERTQNGSVVEAICAAVPTEEGELSRLVVTARDVTDSRRLEEQLRQSQKMEAVGQLTGGIAHDFNNLLQGVAGSLELMQARLAQGRMAEIGRYVTSATTAVTRASVLTHRLLAFARRQALDPKSLNANQLVASIEDLVRRTVGPAIAVETVFSAGLWPTLCDANQLENAILNLAINARDAMPEGGRLAIETANAHLDDAYEQVQGDGDEPGQYVSVSVTDTGMGMAPDVIARVFEPFFTTKPIGQGTGLGLSMVYGFVKQSAGHVRIYSEEGRGTTVRLYLPRHRDRGTEADVPAADGLGAEQAGTVLVVEDEATVRMLMVETLQDLGYRVLEAADSPAGLCAVQSDVRIDLLVTDVGLPGGLNGRQLAEAARERRPELPVLFITGYAHTVALGNGAGLEPGMELMTKPFAFDALVVKVRRMVERRPVMPFG